MDKPTPADLGYFMPAEWQRHSATWLTWPKDPPVHKLQEYLAGHNLFRSDPFEVTHFTLFTSELGSEASVYHAERSYALTARAEPLVQNTGR